MAVAGILLTGGASRRMGRAKAGLDAGGGPLGARTAALLETVASPSVEVGGGPDGPFTRLPFVPDSSPGAGPLAAMASGADALERMGWSGPVLVVATDLPHLTATMLSWLAAHPGEGSVVPRDGGRPQPLCARYSCADLGVARQLRSTGQTAMRDLLDATEPLYVDPDGPDGWAAAAGDRLAVRDVDTPADFEATGWGGS